jgi:hypothetical protein
MKIIENLPACEMSEEVATIVGFLYARQITQANDHATNHHLSITLTVGIAESDSAKSIVLVRKFYPGVDRHEGELPVLKLFEALVEPEVTDDVE